jgi:hypothetical protein
LGYLLDGRQKIDSEIKLFLDGRGVLHVMASVNLLIKKTSSVAAKSLK